jgi:glycosyltransferase involved in cell wall biosynthesis
MTARVRVGFLVHTFSFGGSETETIELVAGTDPRLVSFTGVAVTHPLPLPEGQPAPGSGFPTIYMARSRHVDPADPRVRHVRDAAEAVRTVVERSDVVVTWGEPWLDRLLPDGPLPKIVVLSKDSGDWARGFLRPNSLLTPYYAANSTAAAAAFPGPLRGRVRVIHNGINPDRVAPRRSREEQRRAWGIGPADLVAGYLGRIEEDKGVGRLVDAVARLPEPWTAVLVGVNPNSRYAAELAGRCEALVPGRHRLLGWTDDVGSALAAMDVFCHPSEHEGFSNSLGEAWLAGVPTVYTEATGAIGDLGEMGVGVRQCADGGEIGRAVLTAWRRRDSLTRRARRVIGSRYLAEHAVARWSEYLLEVHRDARRPRAVLVAPAAMAAEASARVRALRDLDVGAAVLHGDGEVPDDGYWTLATPPGASETVAFWPYANPLRWLRRRRFDPRAETRSFACGCPTFRAGTAEQAGEVLRRVRPDFVVAMGDTSPALPPDAPVVALEDVQPPAMWTSKADPRRPRPAAAVRFAIVGSPRTGSSHLVSLLDSHPEVACWNGELFDPGEQFDRSGWERPRDFLVADVFSVGASAAGFKLLWDAQQRVDRVWDMLAELDVRLVHTVRANVLDSFISHRLAEINGAFTSWYGDWHVRSFAARPEECRGWFDEMARRDEAIRHRAARMRLPRLEIDYEELCAGQGRVLEFLGVDRRPLTSTLRRQRTWPRSFALDNWDELQAHFAGTRWACCFETEREPLAAAAG